MKINQQLFNHPCFHITDYKYLQERGKKDAEILDKWEAQLREAQGPIVHKRTFHLRAV